jgi:Icc-related predicted phosphoesterase
MKILALSDRIVDVVYSPRIRDLYGDVDLVVGCGDLPYYYLEYVTTLLSAPVVYVFGNHDDGQYMSDGRLLTAPEGCISLENRVIEVGGLLLAGLGGSMRYNRESKHQYTEAQMRGRIAALIPTLLRQQIVKGRKLDILVTHSPPHGIHDGQDLPHHGFESFLTLIRHARPRMLLHGHTHLYQRNATTETQYHATTILNVYPLRVVEFSAHE